MKCGFFELDITPPFGSIIPGVFGARLATSSALVPESGDVITNEAIALAKELNAQSGI